MNFWSHDWRDRRNVLNQGISFNTMHHTMANYSTGADITKNIDVDESIFENNMFSQIHSISDPLKKNLADTVITGNIKQKTIDTPTEEKEFFYEAMDTEIIDPTIGPRREYYPTLSGITNFISNIFGTISGAMFHRRSRSPSYFDTDPQLAQEMAAHDWQPSNFVDQNKKSYMEQSAVANDDMNNCRATVVAQVEDKISAVKDLLKNKNYSSTPRPSSTPRVRYRRPKRAFIEPGSVSDSYEDEPATDCYVSLPNEDYIEYVALPNNQNQQFCDIKAPTMKIKLGIVPESMDIVKKIPDVFEKVEIAEPTVIIAKPDIETNSIVSESSDIVQKILNVVDMVEKVEITEPTVINAEPDVETKKEVIASCEDKVAKLKAMLLKRRKPSKQTIDIVPDIIKETEKKLTQSKVIPINKKHDKRFKNPCRLTEKRKKTKLKQKIHNDMVFANEIDSEDISSVENSPAVQSTMKRVPEILPIKCNNTDNDYFDEVKGRFHSASDSDDSFQIVFSDSPKISRMRKPSDCDSEDSFIVFEDSPDSCFTTNNLFDHSSEESDSESDESDFNDSAVDVCKLSHSLSRTVSDLTDEALFDGTKPLENFEITSVVEELDNDEVDCSVRTVDCVRKELSPVKEESPECESVSAKTGLLIDEAKKQRRKELPKKAVSFSEKPPKVHVMRVWSFAARQARAGHWERFSLDRDRFKRRIADVDMAISWVLKPQHRSRVMFQRFMPWWNKQKRIEAEEKKRREAEEKIRIEEERLKAEREGVIEDDLNEEVSVINDYDDEVLKFMNELRDKELVEIKMKAITDLQNYLTQDKKKIARKKERERKLEAELNKNQITTDKALPNGVLPLKC